MTTSRYLALCALVLAGAFAGGYVGNRALPVVHAQMPGADKMVATSFTLVDARGNTQATLRSGSSGAELVLLDAAGKPRVEINPSGGVVIRDGRGKITWSSPRSGFVPAVE
jgi:hypothetical protein